MLKPYVSFVGALITLRWLESGGDAAFVLCALCFTVGFALLDGALLAARTLRGAAASKKAAA